MTPVDEVITFWFGELQPVQWWRADPGLDRFIRELINWRGTALGRLAEIIVLDQFSRNIWRGTARSFASDGMALVLAQEAVAGGADQALPLKMRAFMYMPFMHSESMVIHEQAMMLFSAPGLEDNLRAERQHLEILKRFGRYPHRNEVLLRPTTAEESAFLRNEGRGF